MSIFRNTVFARIEWKAFPKLCQFAADNLNDLEAFELLRVIQAMPGDVRDTTCLSAAFFWDKSPQGHSYWDGVYNRLGTYQPDQDSPVDPIFIGGDSADFKGPTGWEPDVVDGEHAMNVTRDMF